MLRYIQENYDKAISLKQLAEELGYNYSYLSNIFNKAFGCGFLKFVNMFRVESAAQMLRTTDLSMSRVSVYCGFGSIQSFNDQFKQSSGWPPTENRKLHNPQSKNNT